MSKLEVREIGPISGETEVRLADGATAIGFGGGKIMQVIQKVYSTQLSTSSATYVPSGLKTSITPSSTSSKILVIAKISGFYNSNNGESGGAIALFREGASILDEGSDIYGSNSGMKVDAGINFLDSPSSTSSVNYEIRFRRGWGSAQVCHDNNVPSTMILMEVLA